MRSVFKQRVEKTSQNAGHYSRTWHLQCDQSSVRQKAMGDLAAASLPAVQLPLPSDGCIILHL